MVRVVMSETIPSTPDRDRTPEHGDVLDHVAHGMGALAVYVVCPCCQRESSQTLNPTASHQDARQESAADMLCAVVSESTSVDDDEETKVALKDVDREQLLKDIVFVRKELAKASKLPPMYRLWRKAIEESDATFVDDPPIVPWFVDENGIPC